MRETILFARSSTQSVQDSKVLEQMKSEARRKLDMSPEAFPFMTDIITELPGTENDPVTHLKLELSDIEEFTGGKFEGGQLSVRNPEEMVQEVKSPFKPLVYDLDTGTIHDLRTFLIDNQTSIGALKVSKLQITDLAKYKVG